jgi:hypothetical protein
MAQEGVLDEEIDSDMDIPANKNDGERIRETRRRKIVGFQTERMTAGLGFSNAKSGFRRGVRYMEAVTEINFPAQSREPFLKEVKNITEQLFSYCDQNDWSGYDPYDALNSRLLESLPFLNFKIPRLVLTQAAKRCPVNIRPLLLIPKTHNPKALALFLASFIRLSKLGLLADDELVAEMIDRLAAHRSPDSPYWCWGYSFPWQTRTILVPRGAPNLVCTVFVADALMDAYEFSRETSCLNKAASAADYILNELYWTKGNATASFCYPQPSSRTPIHNANFLAAALLCRVYKHSGDQRLLEPALRAARYSASQQKGDGAWEYGESSTQRWVDNFHTGYNLCALRAISKYSGTSEFEEHISLGFKFYRDHFFMEDGAPKYFDNRTYPIDIHSIAQSIITLLALKDLDSGSVGLARSVFEWARDHLWDPRGFFYYQAFPYSTTKISYMRWSQAWMLLALSSLLDEPAFSSG